MHCLGCGYDLRHLEENRCPECGRGFSLDDQHSYGHAKTYRLLRWAKGIGWAAALISAGLGTTAAIGMFTGMHDLVYLIMLWTLLGMPVVLLCCAYVALRTAAGSRISASAAVIAAVLFMFNLSLVTYWPTQLAFLLNRNALNTYAQQTIAQPSTMTQPTNVGSFHVLETSTRVVNGRTQVVLKIMDGAGPVYLVHGMSDTEIERSFNIWSYQQLSDDWHIVHED